MVSKKQGGNQLQFVIISHHHWQQSDNWMKKEPNQNILSRWYSPVSKREPACDPIFQRKYSLSDIRHATQYLHLEYTEKLNCKLFEGLVDCKPTIITTLKWQLFYLQWQFESEEYLSVRDWWLVGVPRG